MKIRLNYVSNSSSSSYVIACKGEDIANKVIEAYNKLVEYWEETHSKSNYFDTYYVKESAEDIINNFSDYFGFSQIESNQLKKEWKDKEKEGYVLLYGMCSNEYDIDGYFVMNMFNEYVLNSLKDENDQYLDTEIIFDRRGS